MIRLEDKNHLYNAIQKDVRYDGRKRTEYRSIEIKTGHIETAEGSAEVTIGDTRVIAGVKLSVGSPYSDTPDNGSLMVNTELLPTADEDYEAGPPTIEAIELARVIDRSIREGDAIDSKNLCIRSGDLVWNVSVDICVLNDAGNLFDASSLAAMAAIRNSVYPELDEQDNVDYKHKTTNKLPLEKQPVAVTVYKVRDQIFVDPLAEEVALSDARLTVGVLDDGTLCALQKGGDAPLTIDEIMSMVSLAQEKVSELRALLPSE
jgi:exosome complex component RRP42